MRTTVAAHGVAILAIAVAISARLLLDPLLNDSQPFVTLFAAIIFVAWYCGRGPALTALGLGAVMAAYLLLRPRYSFRIEQVEYQVGLILYLGIGLGSIALFESMRSRQRQLQQEIASRRGAERDLLQREELLRITFASIGDGIITTDAACNVTHLNAVAEELTGWKDEEARGRPISEVFRIVNETSRTIVESPVEAALREGRVVGLANHTMLIRKDGAERPIADSAAPIRDDTGRTMGAVLIFRDITARKLAQDELRASEVQFRTLVLNSPDVIARLDLEFRYLFISPIVKRYTDIEPDEFIGRTGREAGLPGELWDRFEVACREALRTRSAVTYEFTDGRPGRGRHLVSKIVPEFSPDGSVCSFVQITMDVTERKQVEEALRLEIAKTNRLVDSNIIGVVFGSGERITKANDAFLAIVGYTREELAAGLVLCPEDMADEHSLVDRKVREELRQHGVCKPLQKDYFRKDGSRVPIQLGAALIGPDGHEWVCFVQDMTRIKEVEHELREADRHKDEFLATLAHELRNPLAPIRNAIHLLGAIGPPDDRLQRLKEMIERQVAHMVRLVDDLLEVSRITQGKIELRRTRLPLARIIQNAIETSAPFIEAGRHQLTLAVPDETLTVTGDLVRLSQVVTNLLVNAAKFTPENGHIWLSIEREGDQAVVRVRDSGVGIPPAMLPKVFELFTQAKESARRSQGGLGIGLALVRRLVELHEGTVEARSDGPGQGAEFVIRLPLAPDQEQGNGGGRPDQWQSGASHARILVIDDNVDAADSLSMLLTTLGHEVRTAYDGGSGIEQAASFEPDVILLDLDMPVMSGYETARAVRNLPLSQYVRVIALTGWGQEEDRIRTMDAGFDGHLVKPVELGALQELLRITKQ
jgi:PAS domain S-box-containing protein